MRERITGAILERTGGLTVPELAVLASGTATMGIEILAGRVLAPAFGSSIYTWGSIIGVFMAALSLGYHVGGERAGRNASRPALARLLLFAAAYVGLILVAGDRVLQIGQALPLGPRYGALLPTIILFGPPVYLLGFITPYAAELSRRASTGAASGRVFAVGTVGSIVGAFATTFLLVPALGVAEAELLFGGLLVIAAVVVGEEARPAAVAVALVILGAYAAGTGAVPDGTVYHAQTPYQELTVRDEGSIRTMLLNGQRQSAMDLDDPERHVYTYTRYFHLPFLMVRNDPIDRVLFIGGGGFTGPKRFVRDYDVTVDVVEIDPEVVDAAERYFRVNESERLRIHVMDGRRFLRRTNATYDLIVLDAYRKGAVPFHLTTVEFFRLASDRLDRDGVLLANLIAAPQGPGSRFYRAEYRTMDRIFPQVYAFRTSDSPFTQNLELVATKSAERLTRADLERRNRDRDIGIDLSSAVERMERPDPGDAPVLRDDRAPVDSLLDPVVGSRYVVETE